MQIITSRGVIGGMIRHRRKEKRMTQQGLADLLLVDRQYIWRMENGKINLTLDYLDSVIGKLNCDHVDFLIIVD
jgi:transcriptional regulator with XRE-family HTH domain